MSNTTATLFLDTRTKDKKYGMIKVCVIHKRVTRLYTTKIRIEPAEWQKLQRSIDENGLSSKVKNPELIEAYNILYKEEDSHLNRARNIIEDLGERFSFEAFKYFFENPKLSVKEIDSNNIYSSDLLKSLFVHKQQLERDERYSAVRICNATLLSLERFLETRTMLERQKLRLGANTKELFFEQVSKKFMEEFAKWASREGGQRIDKKTGKYRPLSSASLFAYTTQIKTLFNLAIESKIVSADYYPFGRNKFSVTQVSKNKKALSKTYIEQILSYEPVNEKESFSKDIWVFSYLSNGMNIADICRLKKENLDLEAGKMRFVRKKTSTTTKGDKKDILVILNEVLIDIINRRMDQTDNVYLFGLIQSDYSEKQIKKTIEKIVIGVNVGIRSITQKLGIELDVTSYSARHSFATVLLKNKAPMIFISRAMGHKSITTTQRYFGEFEDDEVKEFVKGLL